MAKSPTRRGKRGDGDRQGGQGKPVADPRKDAPRGGDDDVREAAVPETVGEPAPDANPDEGKLIAAGRDDLLEPGAEPPTLVAAGREDLAEGAVSSERAETCEGTSTPEDSGFSGGEGARESLGGRTAPAPDEPPAAPEGSGGGTPADWPPQDSHPDAGEHDDEHGRSFAARALMLLIFALVIFGLSLWLVPQIAPHLPAGVAQHLMPAQAEMDERLAMLEQQIGAGTAGMSDDVAALREEIAAMAARIAAAEEASATEAAAAGSAPSAEQSEAVAQAEATAAEASERAGTAATAATEAGELAAAAARDAAALAERIAALEARMEEMSGQVTALGDNLAEGGADGEATTPELIAAFSALRAEVAGMRDRLEQQPDFLAATEAARFVTQEDLRSARTALGAEMQEAIDALPASDAIVVTDELQALRDEAEQAVAALEQNIAETRATAEQAAATAGAAEQAATEAVGRVDGAIRDARLAAAAAALTSRLVNGVPFADALDETAELMGTAPPEALAGVAEQGVATTAELLRDFGRPARDAIAADVEARTGGGIIGEARARISTVIGGRPADEQPGDTVEAVLSRVEARLREGEAAMALAEAEALPAHAQAALGGWLDALRARVAAEEAAGEWLSAGGAGTQG